MSRQTPINVLVVDDDKSIQRLLADALAKKGYGVTVEKDGDWAVKSFEKKPFDLVILDLLLPALNGYEVAKRIRALPRGKRVPIIMISGVYKSPVHQKEALAKHGAFAFLEKPFELDDLFDTVKRALHDKVPKAQKPKPPPPPVEEDAVTGEFMADDVQREEVEVVEQQAKKVQAHAPSAGPSIRGDFSQRPFAEVLAELYRWRATGALLLRRAKVKKIVYFRNGTPELVKSNLLVECLGQVLVREKMISEAECEESLTRMKDSGRMQGTVLIDMGCISPHNLQYALTMQLQQKLFDAFRWEEGEYQFNPSVTPPPEPVSLSLTTAQLILEGIRRTYDQKRLDRALDGLADQYLHHSQDPLYALQDAGLNDEERELMTLLDGHKKLSMLRQLEVLPRVDTDRLLFAMKCAQMVEFKDQAAAGKAKAHIAMIAEAAKPPPPVPPPLPPPPPVRPPPLPVQKKDASVLPGLPMPWDDAKLAQPMAPPLTRAAPLPPPVPSPPRKARAAEAPPVRSGSLMPELSAVISLNQLSNDEGVVRERLAAKVAAMRRLDLFEVLGIRRNANREDIKRAYFALAKEYHPDKHYHSSSAEVRHLAQEIYDLVSTAHDTLTDPAERERYLKDLAQGVKRDMGDDVGKILAAEGRFQRGEELMRQRQYAEAHHLFQEAIAMYADEGEFHAWLGWSLFQVDPEQGEAAVSHIEHAISLNPKLDKSYLFLGYIQKATGRPDKAQRQFEKAIQCNPDCTEALRELRLLGKGRR